MSEREQFEAWANENGIDVRLGPYKDSGYLYLEGAVAWRAWQASRRAALEEAAKVCETAPDCLQDSTFDGAARAIRAITDGDKQ